MPCLSRKKVQRLERNFNLKKSVSYDFVSINTTGPCKMKNKICSCFDPTQPVAHISIISTSDNFNFNKSPTSHNIIGSVFIHKQNLLNNLGESQQFWRYAIYWFMENPLPSNSEILSVGEKHLINRFNQKLHASKLASGRRQQGLLYVKQVLQR